MNVFGYLYIIALPNKEKTLEEVENENEDMSLQNEDMDDIQVEQVEDRQAILAEIFEEDIDDNMDIEEEEEIEEIEYKVVSEEMVDNEEEVLEEEITNVDKSGIIVLVVVTGVLIAMAIGVIILDMITKTA